MKKIIQNQIEKYKVKFNKENRIKTISSGIIQIIIFVLIFWGVNKWQTKDLLDNALTAPDFQLEDFNKKKYQLSDYKGKNVLIYFFSPWCFVCKHNIENLNAIHEKDLVVLAVGLGYNNNLKVLKDYIKKHNLKVPALIGNSKIEIDYKIRAYPTIYFIDKKGHIKDKAIGYTTKWGMTFRAN